MVGGTAIALQIGHRRSVDFDLFTGNKLRKTRLRAVLKEAAFPQQLLHEDVDQFHVLCNHVKLTFFSYPYRVPHQVPAGDFAGMPTLLSLAAMKALALGRRAKWKDYVDMYFILSDYYTIEEISLEAHRLFDGQYSEKLFREQLAYHADIDYSEAVDYVRTPLADEVIKQELTEIATRIL